MSKNMTYILFGVGALVVLLVLGKSTAAATTAAPVSPTTAGALGIATGLLGFGEGIATLVSGSSTTATPTSTSDSLTQSQALAVGAASPELIDVSDD